jgi:hypothetical protein
MATTLSTTLILQKTLAAYRTLFPFMGRMGTAFDDSPLRYLDTVKAHIRTLPSATSYDGTTGYQVNGNSARSLLTDVPITVDNHKHVPILFEHLNLIKDQKDVYEGAIADAAYVLGKAMVDSVLAKVKSSNISYGETATTANSDLDVIANITTTMNTNGAMPMGRIGLVSSAVAQALELDTRVQSRDYYGITTGESSLRVFRNVGGFAAIYEYPDLPGNNAATQTFTAATTDICTATAHGFQTGDRVRVSSTTTLPAGLSAATTYYVIYLTANTFKLATSDANATAGTAIDITDTGTGTHSIVGYENVTGLFFSPESIAIRAGVPSQTSELAATLGIPQTMLMEKLSDPTSGFSLGLMKWQAAGTGDLWISPTSIWGSAIGRQAGTAGAITDKGALILRSA